MTSAEQETVDAVSKDYWQDGAWLDHRTSRVWRTYADGLHTRLLERWLRSGGGTVLKTDLYEEAVGTGQVPWLSKNFETVTGIDVSGDVLGAAERKNPGLIALEADTRALPFADGSFDAVVSFSTLDHFEDPADIGRSMTEISRVLAPGGRLILTLDNPANPIVWLRQILPRGVVSRSGLVPYFCGATLHPSDMRRVLEQAGLSVEAMTANMHFPRILAVPAARLLDGTGREGLARAFLGTLSAFEVLERLPTRFRTGHFTAVMGRKPMDHAADQTPT